MIDKKALLARLQAFRYPLLIGLVGVCLLLLPTGTKAQPTQPDPATVLEETLGEARGVGRVRVLLSEKGAVVVCDGAENAAVRLDILRAIGAYTGFGSDRITVLKMTD